MPYIIHDRGKDEDVYVPTPEEAAEIDAGFEEIERGEYVDWDDVREAFLNRNR